MKKLATVLFLCCLMAFMCIFVSADEYVARKVPGSYRWLYTFSDGYAHLIKDKTVGFTEEDNVLVDRNGKVVEGIDDTELFYGGNCISDYHDADGTRHAVIGQLNNPKIDIVTNDYAEVSPYEDYVEYDGVLYTFSGEVLYDKTEVKRVWDYGNKYIACIDNEDKITFVNRYTGEAFEEVNLFEYFDSDNDDVLAISVEGKGENYYRGIDRNGNVLFEKEILLDSYHKLGATRASMLKYQNGYCVLYHNYSRTYFVIDREGNIVVDYDIYSYIGDFTDGCARVKFKYSSGASYYNLIDTNGNLLLEKNHGYIGPFSEGLAEYSIPFASRGFMDTKGNHVIECVPATNFENGIAIVHIDGGQALMDKSGKIISKVYTAIYMETEGLYLVYNSNEKDSQKPMSVGFIDRTGAEVIPVGAFWGSPLDNYRYSYRYDQPVFESGVAFLSKGATFYVVENPLLKKKIYVQRTTSKIMIDGKEVELGAYNIYGYNYFKIRDLAMALSGTDKQFDVAWDSKYEGITLQTNTPYVPVGGELAPIAETMSVAYHRFPKIYKNGLPMIQEKSRSWYNQDTTYSDRTSDAFNINGNNYFKLRDICRILDIGLAWDAESSTIHIKTAESYIE